MKRVLLCLVTLALFPFLGCTPEQRSPDAIRHDTAKATTEVAQDAKAVVQGVKDSLTNKGSADHKGAVDINKATPEQLEALPGISAAQAHRIVAGRPYTSTDELVKRHLVSKAEYDRISGQVEAD
jgi:DNA uptake protein ComE-like DNA-binding protein